MLRCFTIRPPANVVYCLVVAASRCGCPFVSRTQSPLEWGYSPKKVLDLYGWRDDRLIAPWSRVAWDRSPKWRLRYGASAFSSCCGCWMVACDYLQSSMVRDECGRGEALISV
ncbi:unnamed protein product [Toxocara canis]|uniref:Secreted protein n=1 Tax=Toxocara canis TaxID=6265 RepID=A0A183UBA5_TOXCA|nr:unnamed protein product [Toxocara canis]